MGWRGGCLREDARDDHGHQQQPQQPHGRCVRCRRLAQMEGAALSTKTKSPEGRRAPAPTIRKHGRRTLPRPCRAPAASCCSCTRSCCVHLAYSSVGRRCVAGPLPPRRRLGPAGVVRLAPPAFGPSHARRAPWQRAHPPAHPAALHAPPAVSCSFVCQCALCVLACGGHACRGGGMDPGLPSLPPARIPGLQPPLQAGRPPPAPAGESHPSATTTQSRCPAACPPGWSQGHGALSRDWQCDSASRLRHPPSRRVRAPWQ
jgi:hypothetical protein